MFSEFSVDGKCRWRLPQILAFSLQQGHFDPKFQLEWVPITILLLRKLDERNFTGYENFGILALFVFFHNSRVWQTDRHFAHRYKTALHRCSAVKIHGERAVMYAKLMLIKFSVTVISAGPVRKKTAIVRRDEPWTDFQDNHACSECKCGMLVLRSVTIASHLVSVACDSLQALLEPVDWPSATCTADIIN